MNKETVFLLFLTIAGVVLFILYMRIQDNSHIEENNEQHLVIKSPNINLIHYFYQLSEQIMYKLAYLQELDCLNKKSAEISSMVLSEDEIASIYVSDEFVDIRKNMYKGQLKCLYGEFQIIYPLVRDYLNFDTRNTYDELEQKIISRLLAK